MQIKKKLPSLHIFTVLSFFTLFFFIKTLSTEIPTQAQTKNTVPTEQIDLARRLCLRFAQAAYDLIQNQKPLKDTLALFHDPQVAPVKKFKPVRLLTKGQWRKATKIVKLESCFEPKFIESWIQNNKFLILDNIDNNIFKDELVLVESIICEFCLSCEIVAKKIGPYGEAQNILQNIQAMGLRIEAEAYSSQLSIPEKLKTLLWGNSFSYKTLPALLTLSSTLSKFIGYIYIIFDLSGIPTCKELLKNLTSSPTIFVVNSLGSSIANVYKKSQKDAYKLYKRRLEAENKRKETSFKKTPKSTIRFTDIIGYEKEKAFLKSIIIAAMTNPIKSRVFGAYVPSGLLLTGPPGCGKTMLAKAIAGEIGCPCWYLCSTELFGDREQTATQKIDDLFSLASFFAPSIIIVDELDFIGSRKNDSDKSNSNKAQALAKLLTKLSGFNSKNPYRPVFFIATANYLENIDQALMRSGRFDIHLTLGSPASTERKKMLELQLKTVLLMDETSKILDIDELVVLTEGLSFADIVNLVNTARLKSTLRKEKVPSIKDFEDAIKNIK